jgi:Flp pilus assembly protein TadD
VGHSTIGNVLLSQGDLPGALAEYRTALGVTEALATKDPTNAYFQHDLAICHDKLG